MKTFLFALLTSLLSLDAVAAIDCIAQEGQDASHLAGRIKFNCGKGKRSFQALCDLSTDPVETGKKSLDVKKAKWVTHGKNQGIEGQFGFIVCEKNPKP